MDERQWHARSLRRRTRDEWSLRAVLLHWTNMSSRRVPNSRLWARANLGRGS
jgi:hypothetical protein